MICPLLSINGIEWVTCNEGVAKLNSSRRGHVCSFWLVKKTANAQGQEIDFGACAVVVAAHALVDLAVHADRQEKLLEMRE